MSEWTWSSWSTPSSTPVVRPGREQRAVDIHRVVVRRPAPAVAVQVAATGQGGQLHREQRRAPLAGAVDPQPVVGQQDGQVQVARRPRRTVGDHRVAAHPVEGVVEAKGLLDLGDEGVRGRRRGVVVGFLQGVADRVRFQRGQQGVAGQRPAHAVDAALGSDRLAPDRQHLAAARHRGQVDRHDQRGRGPARQQVLGRPAARVAPAVQDPRRGRLVESRAAGLVHGRAGLQRGGGEVVGLARALDVVEERIVTQAGEDAEAVAARDQPLGMACIAPRLVAARLAADLRAGEPAGDRRRRGRLAEPRAAVDVEDIGQVLGEPVADDRHHQVQLAPIRRGPGEDVADVGPGIGDDAGRVEMVGGVRGTGDGQQQGRCSPKAGRQRAADVGCRGHRAAPDDRSRRKPRKSGCPLSKSLAICARRPAAVRTQ
jgi:hypothetical protein